MLFKFSRLGGSAGRNLFSGCRPSVSRRPGRMRPLRQPPRPTTPFRRAEASFRFDTSADQSAALVPAPFSRHIGSGRLFIRLGCLFKVLAHLKSPRWDLCLNVTTNHVTCKPPISSVKGAVNYVTSGCPLIIDRRPLNTQSWRRADWRSLRPLWLILALTFT